MFLYYVCENGNLNLFNFYYEFLLNFLNIIVNLEIDSNFFLDFVFENILIIYKNMENNVNYCEIYFLFLDESNVYRLKLFIFYEYLIFFMLKRLVMFRDIIR